MKVKSSAKADKRKYIDALATEAQNAASKSEQAATALLHLCGKKSNRNVPVKSIELRQQTRRKIGRSFQGGINPANQAAFRRRQ